MGRIRLTNVDIKFMSDTVAVARFRELGFDGMDRKVFQHDVSAFLIKEERDWKVYAMAAGDIVFDREGLEEDWEWYYADRSMIDHGEQREQEPR